MMYYHVLLFSVIYNFFLSVHIESTWPTHPNFHEPTTLCCTTTPSFKSRET